VLAALSLLVASHFLFHLVDLSLQVSNLGVFALYARDQTRSVDILVVLQRVHLA